MATGLAVFLALTFRPSVEGDGVGYYSYLHAVFVSHNLSFRSEYHAAISSGTPLYMPLVTTRSANGQLADFFPVGSAILSSPAYVVTLLVHRSGEPQYGPPFVQVFALSSVFYLLLALALCYRFAMDVNGSRASALIGLFAAFLSTPLLYYGLTDPSYSHAFSIFCCSAFIYAWWKGPPKSAMWWFGLGLLGGVMAMTRFQDGLLMAVVLIDFKRLRWPALMLVPGAIVGFAPQLVVDHVQFPRTGWVPLAALSAWNLVLQANFVYVMNSTSSPIGYLDLLRGQASALNFVPRLFVKGAVVSDLLFWKQLHSHFNPVGGIATLAAELACALAAAVVALSQNLRRVATIG